LHKVVGLNLFSEETAVVIVSQVMDLYARMDKAVTEFQLKSGLRCPPGCGSCCPAADVQVTVLEMLPAAYEILSNAKAADWMERLTALPEPNRCVLYAAQPSPGAAGNCSYYNWRPTLCRLFGFASVRNRTGIKALAVCRHIKQTDPHSAAAAIKLAEEAPSFIHFSTQVYALNPALGTRLMPINMALRQAIERTGLNILFAYRETLRDNTAA
jgi:Fe-S-cluster containining protein